MYPQFRYLTWFPKRLVILFFFSFFILKFDGIDAQCSSLLLTPSNSPLNCQTSTANGTITISNGTPPYTYTWLPTGGNASVAIGLTPNSYTIIAKDVNGCAGTTQLIINNTTGVIVNMSAIPASCTGPPNGTVIANVTGPANFPLTYSWTPSAPNSSVITGPAGNYSVLVIDNAGCQYTGSTILNAPASISANIAAQSITCNGGLSSATVTATGGSGTYTYNWTPVAGTNSVISNLPANDYTCTVKDGSGCISTVTISITQPPAIQNTLTTINVSCNTYTNGQASSNVIGGTPAYSFTWSPVNVHASSVSGLGAGNYTLIIKDSKGCTLTQSFVITQPPPLTYSITHTDEFCINADGTATVNVNGGNGGYTYSWTTTAAQTSSVATNLAAGNYSVFITDSKGCKNTGAVTIGNISNMSANISSQVNVTCNSACNGVATAGVIGGSGPYSYNWLGIPGATLATVNNLCPGTYTVKISDVSGCYTNTSVTITEPPPVTYSISGTNVICYGKSAVLNATVNGGTPGYTYNWQPGSLTGSSITVSPPTTTGYSLVVTDSKGCSGAPKVFSVTVNAPIGINTGANSLTVCPNVSTSITVNANGGDGNYSYQWQPGNLNTNSINVNLQNSTIYTVTISDGCGTTPVSTTVNVTVFSVQNPSFTISNSSGCEPFCVQFTNTSSGTTTATWNFGDFTPPVQSPAVTHCFSKAGIYSVVLSITNSFGCKFSLIKPGCVTVYGKPVADYVQHPANIDLNNNDATFENTSTNSTIFTWVLDGIKVGTGNSLEHQFMDTGCYNLKLIASNQSSCSDTIDKQICVKEGFNFWMPNAFTPDADTKNDYLIPKGTGWITDNYEFEIYNRWGELIFKTSDVTGSWDGKYNGSKATDEVYVWHVFVKDIYDKEHDLRGHVFIMR